MDEQTWIRRKSKAKNEGNLDQLTYACRKLAELHLKYNRYEEALKEYKEEAQACEVLGNVINLAVANRMIGEVYCSMGEYKKALKHQMIHLNLAREKAVQIEEQRALATIGRTYFCEAESVVNESDKYKTLLANAKNAYKKSLDLCERLKMIGKREHMEMRARLLLNIGLVLECQHEIEKAVYNVRNAVQICKGHDLFEDLFRCYSSLGMLHHRQNDSSKAMQMLELALDVAERLEDKVQLSCEILINKAEVLFSLPDFHGAKSVLCQAYKRKTPIEADQMSIARNLKLAIAMCDVEEQLLHVSDSDYVTRKKLYESMGDGCAAVKNYGKALEYYQKMLECAEHLGESGQQLAAVYVSLSQTYKDNEQYDLALKFFHKELELWENNPLEACKTTLNICEVLELKGCCYEKLEKVFNKARSLAQQASNLKLEATVLRGLLGVQKLKSCNELAIETQRELQLIGKNLEDETSDSGEEEASPEIGHDICLETYADSDSTNEEYDRPNQSRRQPRRVKVRKNEKGETQLHTACINGNLALVKRLIEQGHPVNVRDHCGWLPLHEASNHGHRDIVEFLLDKGAALNDRGGSKCGGVTPLHDAASCGNLYVVELFLDRGAAVVSRTNEGETPLDCLLKWYQRTDTKFGPVEQSFFDEIQMRMKTALVKAGHSVDNPTLQINNAEGNSKTCRKSRSKSDVNLRRVLDDASSGDEDRAPRWHLVSPVRDGSLSDSSDGPPPEYQQDLVGDNDDGWIGSRPSSEDATEEYRSVMTMLRNKEKANKQSEKVLCPEERDMEGFLPENDVGEDWLEDDVASISRPNKRRRLAAPIEKQRLEFMAGPSTRVNSVDTGENDEEFIEEVLTPVMEQREQLHVITVPQKKRTREMNVRRQSSISDMDFLIKQSQKSSPQSNISVEVAVSQPSRSTDVGSLSVRVRVEDRLLLVPVRNPEEKTIGWLANEAARRYCSVEGLKPSLSLLTRDGALLSEDDPVSLVGNEEVTSTVSSWNIPLLTDRYMEACRSLHSDPDTHISSCLEASQATQSLELSDLALPALHLPPLFRALNRQHTLQELHLAGNYLGDDGVKMLLLSLPTLTQLKDLDLSCNNISSDGIFQLCSIFSNSRGPILEALVRLNLSHNPIGDGSVKHLAVILSHLATLTGLQLQDCHFTANCFASSDFVLHLNSIHELDISYNALGGNGVSGFLGQLSPSQIVHLNIAATAATSDCSSVIRELTFMLEEKGEFNKLTSLNLSDLRLRDEDIWNLLQAVQKCVALDTLQLSGNTELSSVSLRRLMQRTPTFRYIDLAGCVSITTYMENSSPQLWMMHHNCKKLESLTINSQDCGKGRMEEVWREAWGGRACVHRAPGGLMCLSINK